MRKLIVVWSALTLMQYAAQAEGYIGPGAGAGTIAVVLGVIASTSLALVGIVWYPLKRLWRGWKKRSKRKSGLRTDME